MKISELRTGQGNVEVEGVIVEFGERRTFSKFGRELVVANALLRDDSGTIKLTLWNDDATRFKEGDKIKITNGYVNEFQGEKQLTSGKFGRIEKIGEDENLKKEDKKEKVEKTSEKSDEFNTDDISDEEVKEEFY